LRPNSAIEREKPHPATLIAMSRMSIAEFETHQARIRAGATQPQYALGIDPGVHCGYARYCCTTRKLVEVSTLGFWGVYDHVRTTYTPDQVEIFIEKTPRNRLYARRDGMAGRVRDRVAGNVGANQMIATLLIEGFRALGYSVTEVKPTSAKWTLGEFKRLTGYYGRTSEHGRDAAKLIFGR